jgi:putative transposase
VQRGNNRQICFGDAADFGAYAHWLREATERWRVALHAWVFMNNHVHLLATPAEDAAVSGMMQDLGRRYVRYFNKRWGRSGTLWEGRFKSCLVQDGRYLLQCHRYIELNPVRAGMVSAPAEYGWSSYRANALGHESSLRTPHPEYLALGNGATRLRHYQALVAEQLGDDATGRIRYVTERGLAFGGPEFVRGMEKDTGRQLRPGKRGRPPKDDARA